MGVQPTRPNENRARRHPRESGGPFSVWNPMDSRLRGNDVIFGGAPISWDDEGSPQFPMVRGFTNNCSDPSLRSG